MPAEAWRSRLAGAFQDFFRFEFRARHTVGVGDVPAPRRRARGGRGRRPRGRRRRGRPAAGRARDAARPDLARGRGGQLRPVAEARAGPRLHARSSAAPGAGRADRGARRRDRARALRALCGGRARRKIERRRRPGRWPDHDPGLAPLQHRADGRSHRRARRLAAWSRWAPTKSSWPRAARTPSSTASRRRRTAEEIAPAWHAGCRFPRRRSSASNRSEPPVIGIPRRGMEEPPHAREEPDLHGNAPDKSDVALLLIDVINDLEFPEGDQLLRFALPMADRIARAEGAGRRAGRAGHLRQRQLRPLAVRLQRPGRALPEDGVRGRPVVELLRPEEDDYFVLKPKHSGFFSTTLDILLEYLGRRTLILTGMAANICVLFTANDAYMRDFHLVVPARLRGVEHRGGEPPRAGADAQGPQGRHPPVGRAAARRTRPATVAGRRSPATPFDHRPPVSGSAAWRRLVATVLSQVRRSSASWPASVNGSSPELK